MIAETAALIAHLALRHAVQCSGAWPAHGCFCRYY
jgi:hypothetical protein